MPAGSRSEVRGHDRCSDRTHTIRQSHCDPTDRREAYHAMLTRAPYLGYAVSSSKR